MTRAAELLQVWTAMVRLGIDDLDEQNRWLPILHRATFRLRPSGGTWSYLRGVDPSIGRMPQVFLYTRRPDASFPKRLGAAIRSAVPPGTSFEVRMLDGRDGAAGPEPVRAALQDARIAQWQSQLGLAYLKSRGALEDPIFTAAALLDWTLAQLGLSPEERGKIALRRLSFVHDGQEPLGRLEDHPVGAALINALGRAPPNAWPVRWTEASTRRHFAGAAGLRRILERGAPLLQGALAEQEAWTSRKHALRFLASLIQLHFNRLGVMNRVPPATALFAVYHRKKRPAPRPGAFAWVVEGIFHRGWNAGPAPAERTR